MKTRWDRYQLHMMPLYQFDPDQVYISIIYLLENPALPGLLPTKVNHLKLEVLTWFRPRSNFESNQSGAL